MAANLDYLHRQPNANTKLDLRSPIVDRGKIPIIRFTGFPIITILIVSILQRSIDLLVLLVKDG